MDNIIDDVAKKAKNNYKSVLQQNLSEKNCSKSCFVASQTPEIEHLETFEIGDVSILKQATVYYLLKEQNISEHHITNLRKIKGAIKINGEDATTRSKLKNGDTLQILLSAQTPTQTNLCDGELDILFEDDDYLIVNKPHNLASTPTRSHFSMNLGGQICKYMLQKDRSFVLRILNRLDKDTAGIVIVAKNVLAYNALANEQKADNQSPSNDNKICKEYFALASGNIYENITINAPILTINNNGINEMKRIVSPQGKNAITHLQVISNFSPQNQSQQNAARKNDLQNSQSTPSTPFCLVKLTLETGRTHQIRVHLSSIGHALLGDKIYANTPVSLSASHTMLILKAISFTHFRTKKEVCLEVPFPKEWDNFLAKLER